MYASFWEEATAGYEPRASVQAVVFAAWFSAAVAMDESAINREFGLTKANLMENMKVGTEVALSKANFLRTTRVETMQAFVMYLVSRLFERRQKPKMRNMVTMLIAPRSHCAETRYLEHILCLWALPLGWQNAWDYTGTAAKHITSTLWRHMCGV